MHSLGDFQDGKENSSLSAPGDKPLRGSDESQDARLTKRLEELEKQLGRLEGIGLSGSDPQETLAQVPGDPSRAGMHADVPRPEKGPRTPILVRQDQPVEKPTRESATEAWQGNVRNPGPPPAMQQITVREPLARMDQLAERHPSALIDQLGVLQSQAIQEYRAEMARWLQVTVEETRCRLNSLANEIRCRLQAEMNESLGNLAGELAGQMAQSLQRDVETATHHTAAAVLEGAQSVAAQLAAGSGMRRLSGEIGSCQGVQAPRGDPAQALPSAAEGVQNKSALLLRDLEGQLHAVLHAFQERATRQVAEEFQNVAGGLLRREIEQLQTKGLTAELEQPLEGLRSEAQHGSSQAAGRRRDFPQGLADFWPKSSVQGFWRARRQTIPTENTGTPGGNAPKWRILGLG